MSHSFDENLVTALAQVQQVRIVSPSTVRRYRDAKVPSHIMARVLGMDAVIEGTIQAEASRVRATARLVDASPQTSSLTSSRHENHKRRISECDLNDYSAPKRATLRA